MEAMRGCVFLVSFCQSTLLLKFRYGRHAKRSETHAIRAGLISSAVMGGMYFSGLGIFGVGFW